MAKFWAKTWARRLAEVLLGGVCLHFAVGDGVAQAQGLRFGLWHFGVPAFGGSRFDGPRYDGPRYDGPRRYEMEPPSEEPPIGPPPDMSPLGPRVCYKPAEARDRVSSHKLHEPFALMRDASAFAHAEALAGRLCHWNDLDIYEITLLRPDGRVIHVFMNAASGQLVGARNAH
jgi:hypothetical protein